MYLIGATHRHKVDAQRLLERAIADREKLVTDATELRASCDSPASPPRKK